MLINKAPGEPWEYGCVVAVPQLIIDGLDSPRATLASVPEKYRLPGELGIRCVRMIVDGVALHFIIGSNQAMKAWRGAALFLQKDGRLPIVVEDGAKIPFLNDYFKTVALNDRVAHAPPTARSARSVIRTLRSNINPVER